MTTEVIAEPRDQTLDPVVAHQEIARRLRKVRDLQRGRAIHEATYRDQLAEVELYWKQQREDFDREIAHQEQMIRPLVALLVQDEPRGRKSVETPAGRAGFRSGRQSVKVDNADECMAWLTEHAPELVRVKREPDLRALHARMVDGERFPGLTLATGEDAFFVDISGEQP